MYLYHPFDVEMLVAIPQVSQVVPSQSPQVGWGGKGRLENKGKILLNAGDDIPRPDVPAGGHIPAGGLILHHCLLDEVVPRPERRATYRSMAYHKGRGGFCIWPVHTHATGTGPRCLSFRPSGRRSAAALPTGRKSGATTTRKPMLSLKLSGWLLLR